MTTVQIVGIAVAAAVIVLLVIALLVTRRRRSSDRETAAQSGASFLDTAPQDTLSSLGRAEHPVEDVTLDPAGTRALRDAAPTAAAARLADAGVDHEGPLSLDWGPPPPVPAAEPAVEPPPVVALAARDAAGHKVPLSDIIVTTNNKLIDLDDPEVRHMLTDLVKFEIDQATRYREQGQTIDAVLQLTEAEKISRALGMQESAAAIHKMMEDLTRQT
jgi:hypothetical protein